MRLWIRSQTSSRTHPRELCVCAKAANKTLQQRAFSPFLQLNSVARFVSSHLIPSGRIFAPSMCLAARKQRGSARLASRKPPTRSGRLNVVGKIEPRLFLLNSITMAK